MRKSGWNTLQAGLVAGAVLRHTAGFSHPAPVYCPPHAHPALEIVFHPTGKGVTEFSTGAKEFFTAGDVVVYAPGLRHDQRMTEPGVDCCVQLTVPAGSRPAGCLRVGGLDDVTLRAELEYLAARSPGESATGDALLNLRATAALLQLLELAASRTNPTMARLERHVLNAEHYIRDHCATIVSVGEIARVAGVGPDHLRHLFRQRRNKSLIAYLNESRLARARTLLAHTMLPIKEVAASCGFRDVYYFTTIFTKRCGLAPGRYRAKHLLAMK